MSLKELFADILDNYETKRTMIHPADGKQNITSSNPEISKLRERLRSALGGLAEKYHVEMKKPLQGSGNAPKLESAQIGFYAPGHHPGIGIYVFFCFKEERIILCIGHGHNPQPPSALSSKFGEEALSQLQSRGFRKREKYSYPEKEYPREKLDDEMILADLEETLKTYQICINRFANEIDAFLNDKSRHSHENFDTQPQPDDQITMNNSLNKIFYGPPGTGKTYRLKKDCFSKYESDGVPRYDFVTFHQSFSYEDFVEGIKPAVHRQESSGEIFYEVQDGVFKQLAERARQDTENNYAIFIDEINRGNVASIFGELISLIEEDKREGQENALSVKLPYSKKEFSVPPNLHIYGTMNTADRSVELLDTALRRRFSFEEMMPDTAVLKNIKCGSVSLADLLSCINERIERLIDRDHTIGHAYFISIDQSANPLGQLKMVFRDKIIPLLKEYFYSDLSKITVVLGSAFCKVQSDKYGFITSEHVDSDLLTERRVFTLMDPTTLEEADFINIYRQARPG